MPLMKSCSILEKADFRGALFSCFVPVLGAEASTQFRGLSQEPN